MRQAECEDNERFLCPCPDPLTGLAEATGEIQREREVDRFTTEYAFDRAWRGGCAMVISEYVLCCGKWQQQHEMFASKVHYIQQVVTRS